MKRTASSTTLLLVAGSVVVALNGWGAPSQAAKPAARASKSGLTSQQIAALRLAQDNLSRGYADLLATPPDVKGDTSKLEGHMRAAMNFLHSVDPESIQEPPANIPVEDKGHTRTYILDAVKGHLDKAQRVIEGSKVSNADVQQAIKNIVVAGNDVAEIRRIAPK